MIGVRVIVSDNGESTRSRVLLHPQLLLRIDQKPVSFRLAAGILEWDQSLCPGRIETEIRDRCHLDNILQIAVSTTHKDSAALSRIVRFGMPLYYVQVLSLYP